MEKTRLKNMIYYIGSKSKLFRKFYYKITGKWQWGIASAINETPELYYFGDAKITKLDRDDFVGAASGKAEISKEENIKSVKMC